MITFKYTISKLDPLSDEDLQHSLIHLQSGPSSGRIYWCYHGNSGSECNTLIPEKVACLANAGGTGTLLINGVVYIVDRA